MAGIYLHIPFCKQACSYCNFHFSTSSKLKPAVVEAICRELMLRKDFLQGEVIDSIYLGGGTPSLLTQHELQALLGSVFDNFHVAQSAEITLEANPDDLTENVVSKLAGSPVNRLSIGIQSFSDDDLAYMHRAHNASEARAALERSASAGFQSLTVDLIYGTPTMIHEQWAQNLKIVSEYNIRHLSAYQLTVEPRTALASFISKGTAPAPDEVLVIEQFEMLMDWAHEHDYEHYEISNFARPGFRAIHNSNYWKHKAYLGVGPSAHSFDGKRRLWNVANNARYLHMMEDDIAIEGEEHLTAEDRYNELVMTGLRTADGVQLKTIRKIRETLVPYFEEAIQGAMVQGFVVKEADRYTLTRSGKPFADRIASDCFFTEPE